MKKKIRYTEGPIIGELRAIEDFLPPPEELVHAPTRVKITMALSLESLEFFKREAKKYHVPYQKMIRNLLHAYAMRHGAARTSLKETGYDLTTTDNRHRGSLKSRESVVADHKRNKPQ
jgi:hypothetical protein